MSRRPKKIQDKQPQPSDEPRRPAGIQSMDAKLYELVQRAVREMTACTQA